MARNRLELSLNAQKMLEKINKANVNVDRAAYGAATAGARAYDAALRTTCEMADVPDSVTNHIETEITQKGNRTTAIVGWRLQNYNPAAPSAGFKAIFLNYGAPSSGTRTTTKGANRGAIKGRGFIGKAKKMSKNEIKQAQEDFLHEVIKGLQ